MDRIFQCIPNFSEGRDPAIIEAIADPIRQTPGASLIDYSWDVDHNRCVMTILGPAVAIYQAVVAAAAVAVERIDLRTHTGVHPRIGALDVTPVVPLSGATRADAIALADKIGQALAYSHNVPVYYYEWNGREGRKRALPDLRRGGFEANREVELTEGRAPDLGPTRPHPTAGVTVVGARGPLVAYNVNLSTPDINAARAIAARIREERKHLPSLRGVRALGLYLASQARAQVSMNLTSPEQTPLPGVYAFIRHEAAKYGITDLESEIIGAIPTASLAGQPPTAINWHAYRPTQLLETWLPGALSAMEGF